MDSENYVKKALKTRRTKKPWEFYKKLACYYKADKNKAESIIINLPQLGYWKDYFFLMLAARKYRNDNLFGYIMDILINQFKIDINNMHYGKPITTLGKWLPREGNTFDNKLDFVNLFVAKMYPFVFVTYAKKQYRLSCVALSKKVYTGEQILSKPEVNITDIQIQNMSATCFKNNYEKLVKFVPDKVKNYLTVKYGAMDIWTISKLLYKITPDDFQKEIINDVFKRNMYEYKIQVKRIIKQHDNRIISLDFSKGVFNVKKVYIPLAVGLVSTALYIDGEEIILPEEVPDVFSKKNSLLDRTGPCTCLVDNKLFEKYDEVIVITNRELEEGIIGKVIWWNINEDGPIEEINKNEIILNKIYKNPEPINMYLIGFILLLFIWFGLTVFNA